MKTLNLVQGSDEWHAHRRTHFNASDAPAMLGISPYKTRNELLKEYATGLAPEISANTQILFDKGHAFEAIARPWAVEIIGDELYPVVGELEYEGLPLSASFDGITMDEVVCFEHKSLNKDIEAAMDDNDLLEIHCVQMEQQLMILDGEKCLFMASRDGDRDTARHAWYVPDPDMRARIIAGWKQFQADLVDYKPAEAVPVAVATPIKALPALMVQLAGEVKSSNLAVYKKTAMDFIAAINTDLKTDQDFADAANMVKFCENAERELETVKKLALSQTADVDELFRTIDQLSEQMRVKRLNLEKQVTSRREAIKGEIRQRGVDEFAKHIEKLNARIGEPYMPVVPTDFAGAMKGKRTVDSLNEAVDNELWKAKVAADQIADRIILNIRTFSHLVGDHISLFPDVKDLLLKQADDFESVMKVRIADHKEAEAKREASRAQQAAVAAPPSLVQVVAAVAPPAIVAAIAPVAANDATAGAPDRRAEIMAAIVARLHDMTAPELTDMLNAAIRVETTRQPQRSQA